MSLLPSSPDISPDSEPRVVGLDSEEADDLMAALSSTTARQLLAELHEDPAPPGELADRVDTSLQNAQYHLERLEDAGAIEVVGTAYSEKGREMQVYGPADSPLVIFAGEKERASGLRAALSRLFGGFAALVFGSLVVQELFGESILRRTADDAAPPAGTATPTTTPAGGDDGGDAGGYSVETTDTATPAGTEEPTATTVSGGNGGGGATAEPTPEATGTPTEVATEVAEDAATETPAATPEPTLTPAPTAEAADGFDPLALVEGLLGAGLPPGLAFFLGGATVLTLLVAMTYLRAQP